MNKTLAVSGLLIAMLGACGGATSATAPQSNQKSAAQTRSDMDSLMQAIKQEIGTPTATDVSQCGVLPVGAKACGGPVEYLAYSRAVSNETRLKSLADQYAELNRQWNTQTGAISNCMFQLPPTPALENGVCQAKATVAQ